MKTHGYYWCNHCDEPAYGAHCQICHGAAEFKQTVVPPAAPPPETNEPTAPAAKPVDRQDAAKLFSQMHNAVL